MLNLKINTDNLEEHEPKPLLCPGLVTRHKTTAVHVVPTGLQAPEDTFIHVWFDPVLLHSPTPAGSLGVMSQFRAGGGTGLLLCAAVREAAWSAATVRSHFAPT